MPKDDYSSAAGGGLRLKGVNPSSKISKHKKRPKAPAEAEKSTARSEPEASEKPKARSPKDDENGSILDRAEAEESEDETGEGATARGKTQAELQHEERRRRRVCGSSTLLARFDAVEDGLFADSKLDNSSRNA